MLFNKAVFMPSIKENYKNFLDSEIVLSRHAKDRVLTKNIDINKIPSKLKFRNHDVIEIEVDETLTLKKIVVRMHYDEQRDMVVVLYTGAGVLKLATVWLNYKDDKHDTLDVSLYCTEGDWNNSLVNSMKIFEGL